MLKRILCLLWVLTCMFSMQIPALAESAEEELELALQAEEDEEEEEAPEQNAPVQDLGFYVHDEETAKKFAELYLQGDSFDSLYAMYEPVLAMHTAKSYFSKQISSVQHLLGKFVGFGAYNQVQNEKTTTHILELHFEHKTELMMLTMGSAYRGKEKNDGYIKIHGLLFVMVDKDETAIPVSTSQTPPQNEEFTFTTKEVKIGASPWQLNASLVLPQTEKPALAVVFVGGYGAQNQNQSIDQTPLFENIAEYLAKYGVASIRFDKRELQYAEQVKAVGDAFTPQEDSVEDIIAATETILSQNGIDKNRLYYVVYGNGGYLLPSALQQTGLVPSGVIMLSSSPLSVLELRKRALVKEFSTLQNEELFASIQNHLQDLELVDKLYTAKQEEIANMKLFDKTAMYFWHTAQLKPAEFYASAVFPLLILQGDKDTEPIPQQGIQMWSTLLKNKKDVQFKLYAGLKNFVKEGTNTVETAVLQDIVAFVNSKGE